MLLTLHNDIRVILIKLADRLHNMRTIDFLPRDKQIQKCIETLDVYGPIAIRIGMQTLREELEDRAFKCLHPMRARLLKSAIKNDFYNVNIDNLLIIKDDDLINQINHISYDELLELDKFNASNTIRVHNDNKILNISLN